MSRYGVETVIDFSSSLYRPYKTTEAVSQREQLKNMVLKKYMDLYGKKSSKLADEIQKEVNYYFYNQHVNEAGIRILKQRIENLASNPAFGATQIKKQANTALPPVRQSTAEANKQTAPNKQDQSQNDDNLSRRSNARSSHSQQLANAGLKILGQRSQGNQNYEFDQVSMSSSSSRKPKSVYYLEGREEDEWAQLVKFDASMFQKEQEMLRQRQQLIKQRLKEELDKQLQEKQNKVEKEKQDHYEYIRFQDELIKLQDEAEKKKEIEKQNRLQNEKAMREKQKYEIKIKRRQERIREKELDDAMINRIIKEQQDEEINRQKRKEKERERQNQMLIENQINKQKQEEELVKEKKEDIFLQNQYAKLLDDQEEFREREKKERFDKIQKLTKKFENTIQKDIKEQIRQEDEKMLQHILDTNKKIEQEDNERKQKVKDQKVFIKQFLDQQIQEKHNRQIEEEKLNKQQAEIWQKDREHFLDHEDKKKKYIQDVNKQHQKILVDQIKQKDDLTFKGKMSIEELKQNKDRIQRILDQSPDQASYKHAKENSLKRSM
ncbi:hypothetical protein TTHERM_00299910 (macronuclear) [Tetrahymena thermophila SB210]|uniref:Uncharacterized protein n=1 Tax=Tetrahymena thermophila (strain SB210) TaxID=312017 RepID=I7MIC8_TETTS|nr:hypothetical protein TTHERM_00299910 [Tetrahymena thermophila SB210]EAS04273.3 hypothetical protein TTHERM_00299910 [Tetrahymena thermophila SB210]|eukprot:XP_001024518.3 hypothetical protein TTHERM_00299910 [Tetrahymena thermophila SB210]